MAGTPTASINEKLPRLERQNCLRSIPCPLELLDGIALFSAAMRPACLSCAFHDKRVVTTSYNLMRWLKPDYRKIDKIGRRLTFAFF